MIPAAAIITDHLATVNVANRLRQMAALQPNLAAVVETAGRTASGRRKYRQVTFAQLEDDTNRIAAGLRNVGVENGERLALLVRPSIDFVALVFALLKSGAVTILIDPGMGRKNLLRCLEDARPAGFVAIPPVQAVRALLPRRFGAARINVTVGRRWFWGGSTLAKLRRTEAAQFAIAATAPDDPAAIIFTTGSTGPPKGVLYQHRIFDRQVCEIRDQYDIRPGEIDLPCFPLFGLFNAAMGVTTVIPDMDATRPAQVNPRNIIEAVADWNINQAFGSPAVWNRVGRHCEQTGERLPTLRRVLSAGAPVPVDTLRRMRNCIHPQGEMHTPYGATESLPIATISASEVLGETAAQTVQGAGTCVGHRFAGIQWKVIEIDDGPLADMSQIRELPPGQIGELIVRGDVVTRQYVTRVEANATAKIADGPSVWHRMGDVGYLDSSDRFWFCGRMAHRVVTATQTLFSIPCEAIFNQHPQVFRSALVGIGPRGQQQPEIIVEPYAGQFPREATARDQLLRELRALAKTSPLTSDIATIRIHPALPVDIRHNSKIFREQLAVWAEQQELIEQRELHSL